MIIPAYLIPPRSTRAGLRQADRTRLADDGVASWETADNVVPLHVEVGTGSEHESEKLENRTGKVVAK